MSTVGGNRLHFVAEKARKRCREKRA